MKAIKVLLINLFIYLPFLQLRKESYLAGRKICLSWITADTTFFWALSLLTALIWTFQWSGVLIKIEVASGLDRVTDCINKGPLVPSSRWRQGRSKCILPLKILKFQSPKNAIFSVLGTKFEDKRACFSLKKT